MTRTITILSLFTAALVSGSSLASASDQGLGRLPALEIDLDAPLAQRVAATDELPSCRYALVQAPPEGERLCVYLDDAANPLPENPRNGWTYNQTSNVVVFHGSSCEGIQSGRIRYIDIICGCQRR